ncbi:12889_t:CDS:1, partial [Dentiscutata heterogama]
MLSFLFLFCGVIVFNKANVDDVDVNNEAEVDTNVAKDDVDNNVEADIVDILYSLEHCK